MFGAQNHTSQQVSPMASLVFDEGDERRREMKIFLSMGEREQERGVMRIHLFNEHAT